jgi:hypothetical protein
LDCFLNNPLGFEERERVGLQQPRGGGGCMYGEEIASRSTTAECNGEQATLHKERDVDDVDVDSSKGVLVL